MDYDIQDAQAYPLVTPSTQTSHAVLNALKSMGFTLSLDAKKGESGLAEIQQEGTYLRNAFFEWLAKEVPTARLTELKQSAAELEEYCANKKILSSSLFTVSDKASITRLRVRLEGDRLLQFFNRGKSERMLSVLVPSSIMRKFIYKPGM